MGFAIGGAILGGAIIGGLASESAANTEAGAATNAANISESQFQQTQADEAPYLKAGYGALTQMQNPEWQSQFNASNLQNTPGYQFQLQQGEQAIQQSAAAQGLLNSGATMKALNNYAQGAASTEYQNAFNNFQTQQTNSYNRLASLAGLGQTGNQTTATTGAQTAAAVGSDITGAATAQAAGTIGVANSVNGAVGQGMGAWQQQQLLNAINPGSTSYTAAQTPYTSSNFTMPANSLGASATPAE